MTQSTSFHILFTHLLLLFAVTPLHGKVYHFADHGPTDFFAFVFDSGRSWDWDGNEFRLDTTGGESNLRNSGAVVYISEAERALQPDFVVSSTLAYQTDGTPSEFTRLGVVALSDEAQAGGTDPGTSTTRGYWATFMPLMPESGRDGVGSELQILKNGEGVLSAARPHAPVGPGGELRLSLAGSYTPSGDLDLSFTVEANGDSVTTPVFHDSDPLTGGWFGLQHRNQPRVSRIGHRAFAIADIPHPPRTPPENDNEVFVHPGIFNSQSELDRIHALYQSGTPHPILTGLNELITHPLADLSRAHQALETVWIKKAAGTPEEKRIREDAAAAYANTLLWVATGDSARAAKAIQILDDWSATFERMEDVDEPGSIQITLEAAWTAPMWVASAEILRHYQHPEAGSADWRPENIARFETRLLDYFYEKARQPALGMIPRWANTNWATSGILAMMSIGAFSDDHDRYEEGYRAFHDVLPHVLLPDGRNNEMGRDTWHPQYTLMGLIQICEIAHHQGDDLYGLRLDGQETPRLAISLEYFAKLFLGDIPTPVPNTSSGYGDYTKESGKASYEIALNHYRNRRAWAEGPMPRFEHFVHTKQRPESVYPLFLGWSTATHAELSTGHLRPDPPHLTAHSDDQPGTTFFNREDNLHIEATPAQSIGSLRFFINRTPLSPLLTEPPFSLTRVIGDLSSDLPPGPLRIEALQYEDAFGLIPLGPKGVLLLQTLELSEPWTIRNLAEDGAQSSVKQLEDDAFQISEGGSAPNPGDESGAFISRHLLGNGEIIVRISALAEAGPDSRAGIRLGAEDETAPPHAVLSVTGTGTIHLRSRSEVGAGVTESVVATTGLPVWLRLIRSVNQISVATSADGIHWTNVAERSLVLPERVNTGLWVLSEHSTRQASAVFEEVAVTPRSTSFTQWRDMYAITASPLDDPDGDGRPLLLDFALGISPGMPLSSKPSIHVEGDAVHLTTPERPHLDEVVRSLERSTDLEDWATVTANDGEMEALADGRILRTFLMNEERNTAFFRVVYRLAE